MKTESIVTYRASYNLIGGAKEGEGNIISGNEGDGIILSESQMNEIIGNYIGTNTKGDDLGNGEVGVDIYEGLNNDIGAAVEGEGNVIAYNLKKSI